MWPKTAERTVAAAVGTRRIAGETVITSVWVPMGRASETGRARTGRAAERDGERERVSPSD